MFLDPTLAVEHERWHELQRTADRYRLHRHQAAEQQERRDLISRRRLR